MLIPPDPVAMLSPGITNDNKKANYRKSSEERGEIDYFEGEEVAPERKNAPAFHLYITLVIYKYITFGTTREKPRFQGIRSVFRRVIQHRVVTFFLDTAISPCYHRGN